MNPEQLQLALQAICALLVLLLIAIIAIAIIGSMIDRRKRRTRIYSELNGLGQQLRRMR